MAINWKHIDSKKNKMIQYKCDYNMMNEVNLYEKNGKIILGSELLDVG